MLGNDGFFGKKKMSFLCVFVDAKLGKKCNLLDLSQHPTVAEPETQVAALLSSVTSNQEPRSNPPSPSTQTTSGGNLATERMKEEPAKEEADEGKSEELSAEASLEKMEVEPKGSPSNEKQSMSKRCLITKYCLKDNCILTPYLLLFSQALLLGRKRQP